MSSEPLVGADTPRPSPLRQAAVAALALVVITGGAWNVWRQVAPGRRGYEFDQSRPFPFRDDARTNAAPGETAFAGLTFVDAAGSPVDLARYRGRKHVVLVVTRGTTSGRPAEQHVGRICLYCASQTARLVANYAAIAARGAEVVVVFPVVAAADGSALDAFTAAVQRDARRHDQIDVGTAPFPLLLDVGLDVVDRLGLRADLAKPATYVIDKEGRVRFAYVGESAADRPSVKAILGQLAALDVDAP